MAWVYPLVVFGVMVLMFLYWVLRRILDVSVRDLEMGSYWQWLGQELVRGCMYECCSILQYTYYSVYELLFS